MSNPVLTARGRTGHAIKTGDPAKIEDAYRDLAAEKIAAYIEKVVSTAPPLTPAQIHRLTGLFNRPEPRVLRRHASVDEALIGGDA